MNHLQLAYCCSVLSSRDCCHFAVELCHLVIMRCSFVLLPLNLKLVKCQGSFPSSWLSSHIAASREDEFCSSQGSWTGRCPFQCFQSQLRFWPYLVRLCLQLLFFKSKNRWCFHRLWAWPHPLVSLSSGHCGTYSRCCSRRQSTIQCLKAWRWYQICNCWGSDYPWTCYSTCAWCNKNHLDSTSVNESVSLWSVVEKPISSWSS